MRIHRSIPMLAAVATLVGSAAPAAYASDNVAAGSGGAVSSTAQVQHNSSGTGDWLIGLGAAGAVTLAGAGVASSRRASRRRATGTRTAAASGS